MSTYIWINTVDNTSGIESINDSYYYNYKQRPPEPANFLAIWAPICWLEMMTKAMLCLCGFTIKWFCCMAIPKQRSKQNKRKKKIRRNLKYRLQLFNELSVYIQYLGTFKLDPVT